MASRPIGPAVTWFAGQRPAQEGFAALQAVGRLAAAWEAEPVRSAAAALADALWPVAGPRPAAGDVVLERLSSLVSSLRAEFGDEVGNWAAAAWLAYYTQESQS